MRTVAALYVERAGVYSQQPDVEIWDESRDARNYRGPHPVVAHPPCNRWSVLAGMIETRFGYKREEDGGCFASALSAVRTYGGVLEHPAYSAAFQAFDLPIPQYRRGWHGSLTDPGWVTHVEQGWYGHPLRKPTWLYVVGGDLLELEWGPGPGQVLPHRDPTMSATQRQRMTIPTPLAFARLLLSIARHTCPVASATMNAPNATPADNTAA